MKFRGALKFIKMIVGNTIKVKQLLNILQIDRIITGLIIKVLQFEREKSAPKNQYIEIYILNVYYILYKMRQKAENLTKKGNADIFAVVTNL